MADNPSESLLFIITGSRGAGKTSFCQALSKAAKDSGWRVSGLLSLPAFEGQTRTAIEAQDQRSGETRTLATRIPPGAGDLSKGPATLNWQFDKSVIDWGNRVLKDSVPTDLLVIDELGPLEFEREQGWTAGLEVAGSRRYAVALVVIRSELLGEALVQWQDAHIVEIDTPEDSRRKAQALGRQLF